MHGRGWSHTWRGRLLILSLIALVGGSCAGSTDEREPAGAAAQSTTTVDPGRDPRYSGRGPHEVGVTTLQLPDRAVEVYYPAERGSTSGKADAVYDQTEPIPDSLRASLPAIPADVDLSVTVPAVRDVEVGSDGPFPLVIFSHGAGGWRSVYGSVLAGIASWGFVVASTDYAEYGLLASFTPGGDPAARRSQALTSAKATIELMITAGQTGGDRFSGSIDGERIAAAGHSAGGGTMFGLLDDPRIKAVVGWAPVGPQAPVTSRTPTLVIGGEADSAITPEVMAATFAALRAPKRRVEVARMGHNAFSDACLSIRSGTDLIGLAKSLGLPIPDRLLDLGRNGCEDADLDTKLGWSIIQHFTVAELRNVFGTDPQPVGLGAGIETAFAGATIRLTEET